MMCLMFATSEHFASIFVVVFLIFSTQAQWVLVHWPEEDSVSIVKHTSVVHPPLPQFRKGDECDVLIGKKKFTGKFVHKGECCLAYICALIFIIKEDTHLFPQQEKRVSLEKLKSSF